MQLTILSSQKFAIITTRPSTRGNKTLIVTASHNNSQAPTLQRRSLAALIASLPVALPVSRALALIPDDDDEELVEKARANRKSKLATERQAEKAFTRSEGLDNRALKKELVPVQRAVNSLALIGKQLAAGETSAAASTLGDSWVADFRTAADDLSIDGASKASASRVISQLGELQAAAKKGSLADAKAGYVALVGSLAGWVSDAGISNAIKGL